MVVYIYEHHRYSLIRACKLVNLSRSMYYYEHRKDDSEVIEKLASLASAKPMEGQDKLYARIRNEGICWNRKRVARVYKLMNLHKRKRTRKRVPARIKMPLLIPNFPNQTWSMDFMHDSLINGRRFRVVNIIDDYNRELMKTEPYFSISADRLVQIVDRTILERGKPKTIRVDNGPEFISMRLHEWSVEKGIQLQFIQPGRPMQNGLIERFNKSFRQDVLDANLFENIMQVRVLSDEFAHDYNYHRPHESLGNMSPVNYKLKHARCEVF
jgi:putative transposase